VVTQQKVGSGSIANHESALCFSEAELSQRLIQRAPSHENLHAWFVIILPNERPAHKLPLLQSSCRVGLG